MREGLRKGTESMKQNAKSYKFICPICGRTLYVAKWELDRKKYCSLECLAKSGKWKNGVEMSAKMNHNRNLEIKKEVKETITEWAMNHEELIMNCPKNKITTTLSELLDLVYEKYNIKDIRSIFICFNVKNKKELLNELQNLIIISKENVC